MARLGVGTADGRRRGDPAERRARSRAGLARRLVAPRAAPARRPTSARGRRASPVDLAVVHSISLPPGRLRRRRGRAPVHQPPRLRRAPVLRSDCAGLQVSAHFFIRRDGAAAAVRRPATSAPGMPAARRGAARELQRLLDRHRARRAGRRCLRGGAVRAPGGAAALRCRRAIRSPRCRPRARRAGAQGRPGRRLRLARLRRALRRRWPRDRAAGSGRRRR